MRVRENLSAVVSSIGKNNFTAIKKAQVGRVYGVVTTDGTPTPEMFKKAGGYNGVGTIFYLDYDQAKDTTGTVDNNFLNNCKVAKPLYPQFQYYPVLGELVFLEDLPSPASQVSNTSVQKYYISTINLYGNQQQNSQPADKDASLGATFVENPQIKTLLPFEGDHILQGRQGNAIRFSTTTTLFSELNEWSSIGKDDSPITILSNGFAYIPGEKCSPISGKYDRKDPTIYEKDIDRELVLLRDLYYKTDEMPEYHNTVYLDIEIEIRNSCPFH